MARSPTNLQIGVGIDTGKFIADAAIVKNELRDIKKQVDAAAKAGDVAALRAAAEQQAVLERRRLSLNKAVREGTKATDEHTSSLGRLGTAFGAVTGSISTGLTVIRGFSLAVGAAVGSVTAFTYGLVKLADSAAKATDELEDAAAAIGITTNQLLAAQLAGVRVGSSAEVVTKGMERVARMMGEAKKAAGQFDDGIKILRGNVEKTGKSLTVVGGAGGTLVNVLKGTKPAVVDTTNAFTEMEVDLTQFPSNAEGFQNALGVLAERLSELTDASRRARLAQEVWGREWPKQIELLTNYRQNLRDASTLIEAYGIGVSQTESQQSAAWLRAFNTFSFVFERMKTIVGNILGSTFAPFFDQLTTLLGANQEAIRAWATEASKWLLSVAQDILNLIRGGGDEAVQNKWLLEMRDGLVNIKNAVVELIDLFNLLGAGNALQSLNQELKATLAEVGWIVEQVKALKRLLTPAGNPQPTATEVSGGMASGGMVRGPGSGTSDSILARLSNGEFVINSASVRRLGTGFLHSLNNFAAGGLVGMPPIRFAEGGLVSAASGGRPVHLHLGSSSFALSGSSGVVDALVSHAHSQQLRSAGVKPSWFAGRPSGR